MQSCRPKDQDKHGGGHALQHFRVPRSDLHCICVNVTPPSTSESVEDKTRWDIFCFECNSNLYIDSYKKLHEAVEFVRRLSETKSVSAPGASKLKGPTTVAKKSETTVDNSSTASSSDGALNKTRGLVNLGNTCFFNSVMQGLTQSHPFTILFLTRKHCQKGTSFDLPAVELENTDPPRDSRLSELSNEKMQKKNTFDAITLSLEEAGNMTLAFASFLSDMANATAKGAVNPSQLFGQISTRSPQFRGFQQQDAHELLRHLIEGLRMEEVKRQRKAILKFFGLTEKTDPKTVDGHVKKKLQALKQHSNYTVVDKIFGGHLVSTVVCEVCHNSSQNYEPFLDLSLPLIEERDHPPTSKQKQISKSKGGKKLISEESQANNEIDENTDLVTNEEKKSKHQLKKEKRKTKKEKRKNNKVNAKEPNTSNKVENDPPKKELENDKKPIEKSTVEKLKDANELEGTKTTDVKVVIESASEDKESKAGSNHTQDSTTQRLKLRTTSRTPLRSEKEENRSRSISPSISDRMKALSKDQSPNKSENNGTGSSSGKTTLPTTLKSGVAKNMEKFQLLDSSKANKNEGKFSRGGSEEDDEGDAYLDDDEDWEWEYEEPEKNAKENENSDDAVAGSEPEFVDEVEEEIVKVRNIEEVKYFNFN